MNLDKKYEIKADELHIGKGVRIGKNVRISGRYNYAESVFTQIKRVVIGDGVFIGDNVRISCPEVEIGDYTMICDYSQVVGNSPAKIGSCCFFGEYVVINSHGELVIGNGVGVGSHSQLWTHIRFGDTLQGCRWYSDKPMIIEDDVWFVGHCLVSPIHAKKKSMAMLGSVITKDMEENHIYAGVPAIDITDKLGNQFKEVSVDEKYKAMKNKLKDFYFANPDYPKTIEIVKTSKAQEEMKDKSVFNVSDRTYTKQLTEEEIEFMKFLLTIIKFYPTPSSGDMNGI